MNGSEQHPTPTSRSDRVPASSTSAATAGIDAPEKALRIGQMARQLLEEVRHVSLDEAGRERLQAAHERSVRELANALSPELTEELCTLMAPLDDDRAPSSDELMVVQAQLVGWLEGLFQGVRASVLAQQLTAQQQLEEMRRSGVEPDVTRRGGSYL